MNMGDGAGVNTMYITLGARNGPTEVSVDRATGVDVCSRAMIGSYPPHVCRSSAVT